MRFKGPGGWPAARAFRPVSPSFAHFAQMRRSVALRENVSPCTLVGCPPIHCMDLVHPARAHAACTQPAADFCVPNTTRAREARMYEVIR